MSEYLFARKFHSPDFQSPYTPRVHLGIERNAMAQVTAVRFQCQPSKPAAKFLFAYLKIPKFAVLHALAFLEVRLSAGSVEAITAAPGTASTLRTILPRTLGSLRCSSM